MNTLNNPRSSFGWHSISNPMPSMEHKHFIDKASNFFSITCKVSAVALLSIVSIASAFSAPAVSLAAIGAFSLLMAANQGIKLYSHYLTCRMAGIVIKETSVSHQQVEAKPCSLLPTEHCADTVEWRKQLIANAEDNIVISGNYCGGNNFLEVLTLLKQRIEKKPELKVILISSPYFLNEATYEEISKLQKNYPKNFSLIISDDLFHIGPGIKKSTNHSKFFLVDDGRYGIIGGSGIKDNFSQTGLQTLTTEQYLKQRNETQQLDAADFTKNEQNTLTIIDPTTINVDSQDKTATNSITLNASFSDKSFLSRIIPHDFRDMDFVYASDEITNEPAGQSLGNAVYQQALLLALRFEQYNLLKAQQPIELLEAKNLGVFTGKHQQILPEDSLTVQLLKTPITNRNKQPKLQAFHDHSAKAEKVATKIFSSGPEQSESVFAAELLREIKGCQERITIAHMYFHPTEEITQALADAANRGVKVTLITTGEHENSPLSHSGFAPRNKYNYRKLFKKIESQNQKNFEVFEFHQESKGLHKKVIVIDNTVIAGSSNLGYKSLVTTSDHEINFFATSKNFAEETLKVLDVDIKHSKRIEDPTEISLDEIARAELHKALAPLIG